MLLDDQITQVWSQQNPTHAQEVGDCPWVLILQKKQSSYIQCYFIDQHWVKKSETDNSMDIAQQVNQPKTIPRTIPLMKIYEEFTILPG